MFKSKESPLLFTTSVLMPLSLLSLLKSLPVSRSPGCSSDEFVTQFPTLRAAGLLASLLMDIQVVLHVFSSSGIDPRAFPLSYISNLLKPFYFDIGSQWSLNCPGWD